MDSVKNIFEGKVLQQSIFVDPKAYIHPVYYFNNNIIYYYCGPFRLDFILISLHLPMICLC